MRIQTQHLAEIIKRAENNVRFATAPAVKFALEPIFAKSQELVPVRTGKLKRSGFLREDTESRSGVVRVLIGYGRSGDPHYAAFVHEMVHIPHSGGTQAKFLEQPIMEGLGEFESRLVDKMAELSGLGR